MKNHDTEKLTRNEDSLAPIQLDRLSVEEKSLIRHNERFVQLAGITALFGCLIAGGAFVMKKLDAQAAVTSAAAGVQRARNDNLDPFLRCALPGLGRAQLASKERLMGAIDDFSESLGKNYGRTLGRCMPMLEGVAPALASVHAPADLLGQVGALQRSATELTQAVTSYRAYLSAPDEHYDYVKALPLIEKIAVAWDKYEVGSKRFEDAARAKLD